MTMSLVPPMNHVGIDGGGRSLTRAWLASRLRYQLTGPKNPLASNESTYVARSASVSHAGSSVGRRAALAHRVEEAVALGRQRGHRRLRVALAGRRPQDRAHRPLDVGVELGLGRTDGLEVQDVEEAVARRRLEHVGRRGRPLGVRHADVDHGPDPLGVQAGEVPHEQRAPVVADEHGVVVAGRVEQGQQVAGEVVDAVGLDVTRRARAAVAALVGGQHVVAGGGQRLDLVAPRVGALGEAVAEHDGRAGRDRRPR